MGGFGHYYPVFPVKSLYPLPAALTAAGYVETTSRAYRWDGRRRGPESRAIWQYTLSGEGALLLGGREYRISGGEAMLLTIPEEHCYFLPERPGRWEFCYLVMEGECCLQIVRALRERYSSVIRLASGGGCVRAAERLLESARLRLFQSPYRMADEVCSFLFELSRELEEAGARSGAEPPFLRKIFAQLQRNPDLTVEEMAAIAGYSRAYLDRVFRQYTGMTPSGYLRDLRMRKAAGLLANTLLSVKEVAAACGFYDTACFCRMFRKRFGRTPSRYREQELSSAR